MTSGGRWSSVLSWRGPSSWDAVGSPPQLLTDPDQTPPVQLKDEPWGGAELFQTRTPMIGCSELDGGAATTAIRPARTRVGRIVVNDLWISAAV